jgi:hypothetical protein
MAYHNLPFSVIDMKLLQKYSKTGKGEPVIPASDAEELYRRQLRLRAEEDFSQNMMEKTELPVIKLKKSQ